MPRQYNSSQGINSEVASLKQDLAESIELQGYYQKMAEDYRSKYLAMERDYNILKHNVDYEMEVAEQEHRKIQDQLHERIRFE